MLLDISMPAPKIWGPPIWKLFHTLAEKINENVYPLLYVNMFHIIKRICSFLPCPDCSSHASRYLAKVNLQSLKTKVDFKNMLYLFHNYVNIRKRKGLYNYQNIELYKNANIINVVNNFIVVYNTKGNMNMLTESFQRQLVIDDFKKWFSKNITFFMYSQKPINEINIQTISIKEESIKEESIKEPFIEVFTEVVKNTSIEDLPVESKILFEKGVQTEEIFKYLQLKETPFIEIPIQEIVESVEEIIEEVVEAVEEIVEETIEEAVEPLKEIVEAVVEPLKEIVETIEAVEPLKEISEEAVEPLKEISEEVVEPLKEIVESVEEIVEPLKEISEEVVEPLKEISEEVVEALKEIVESVEEIVEPLKEISEEISEEVVEPLKEIVEPIQAVEPLKEIIEEVVEAIEHLKEIVEPIQAIEPLKEIVEPIQAIEPLKEAIEEALKETIQEINVSSSQKKKKNKKKN